MDRRQAGSQATTRFIDALQAALRHIGSYPDSGSPRLATELEIPGLRSWQLSKSPYIVFYLRVENHVDVWRLLHERNDIPDWLR